MANEMCRLCAKQKTGIRIYEQEGLTLNLCSKIAKCLQIQIQPDDLLPKMVCLECCFKLEQSLEFFETSSRAQSVLLLNAEVQREDYVNDLSQQQQHLPDSKDSVPCSSFSNSNILELTQPPQLKLNPQGKKAVISEQRKERKRNVVHCKTKRKSFEVFKVNKSKDTLKQFQLDTKQGDTLQQRVRLDECYSWQCTDCPVVLTSLLELKDHHLKLHGQAVRYQCIECAKVYAVYKKFTRHVRLHRNYGKYRCEECRKSFSSKQAMENHKVLHSGARPYTCAECGKTFRQIGSLYTHRRVHQTEQNGFSCCDCGKLLQTRQSLELHKKSHSGARDYTCDICGKSFVVKQGLAYHMMSHSGERPHCCELCGKRCKTVYLLKKHVATHSNVKAHQCDVCGKQFRENSTLKLHTRIHTGAMPYHCEFCSRQFRFQGVYVIHRRQHTGERPYSCNICKRDFTNWANYNKHIKCRHRGKTTSEKETANFNKCSAAKKLGTNLIQRADTNDASIAVDQSNRDEIKSYELSRNDVDSGVIIEESASAVRINKMVSSLCSIQETCTALKANSFTSSQLYSHVIQPTDGLTECFYSANITQEFRNVCQLQN